jgi:phospholipid/cholesterol/gamma-HCH transport system ATP-binding protein
VTLRQLNGLEKPTAGTVLFDGIELPPLSEPELVPIRRRIAMLFQSGALFDSMTVAQNVSFPLDEHTDWSPTQKAARVEERLTMVGLPGIGAKMPSELSGGMRKRVALARSIVLDPEVVLYDEPTTGLDPVTSASIAALVRRMNQRLGVTSVVVTHDLPLARTVADRIAFLDQGRLRFVGTFAEAEASGDDHLVAFLEGRPDPDPTTALEEPA